MYPRLAEQPGAVAVAIRNFDRARDSIAAATAIGKLLDGYTKLR